MSSSEVVTSFAELDLPAPLQKALADVKFGDFRLYSSPRGNNYVLYVYHVLVPTTQPFDEVKEDIAEKVYKTKLNSSLNEWTEKLKEYYPVIVFLTDIEQI